MESLTAEKICVVTVASHEERGYWLFRKSCARYGFEPIVLGMGEAYHRNTDKLHHLNRFLSHRPTGFSHILFCDAFDVVAASGLSSIATGYMEFESPLVFSAEKSCWPDAAVADQVPPCPIPYRFLNSGLWMGEVSEAAKLVAELARRSTASKSRSDQRLFTEACLSGDFRMVLDHRCSLFQSLHLALDDLEWSDREANFRNKTTGEVPRVLHGNGGSNMYTVVSQLGLIPSFEESFDKAVRRGLMSKNQYGFIADVITSCESCRVLVVGAGHDTELWYHCCRGNMICVEDRVEWFPRLPCKLVCPEYKGRIGTWLPEVAAPKVVAQSSWDVMIIDGPKGDSPDSPGRQEPISWASRYGVKIVIVHDYERDWEHQLCDYYLGEPFQIVPFERRDNRVLAAFNRA